MATGQDFGSISTGETIERVEISSDALVMSVITWGAAIQDLRPRTGSMAARPLVLGLNNAADYEQHSPYFGAIAGRNANRIGNGRFTLDGTEYQLTRNTPAGHHLHGGDRGIGRRAWRIVEVKEDGVTLAIQSPEGDDGYPGTVDATVTYRLNDATVECTLTGTTTAPTLCNLALHSYFNFDGSKSVRHHRVMIAADRITPTDADLIPTGAVESVAGTVYDFRTEHRIDDVAGPADTLYDANYCLALEPVAAPRHVASVESEQSDVRMDVATTEPGIQFYDGAKISMPVAGLDGAKYGAHSGLCLEPQRWPDAPNHEGFPSSVLRPGETYRQITQYRFSW